MKYLIILFTLITISSCCKKVDGVCCDDGVYVRFENQTEYDINRININKVNLVDMTNIYRNELSDMVEVSKAIESEIGVKLYLRVFHNDSLYSFVEIERSIFQDGCSEVIITTMRPDYVFGGGIDFSINKI